MAPDSVAAADRVTFTASGISFAGLAWGPEDGPLALCLHGYPDSAWTWRHLGPALAARGWRVVAPFMRGYAPTGPAPDACYGIGALAHDALAARERLGAGRRAVVVGHDWGAASAYTAAALAPAAFERVVALAVPPTRAFLSVLSPREALRRPADVLGQLRCSWYMGFQQLPALPELVLERLIPRLWSSWSPGYDAREDIEHAQAALPDRAHRAAALSYYRALLRPRRTARAYRAEQAQRAGLPGGPWLYLYGTRDGCMRPATSARTASLLGAHGSCEAIDGAGHFLHLERPEPVNVRIVEFLDSPAPAH